ncbi:MAG: M48 family metalloprotease [Phycisphaerales bacterium]
MHSRTIFGCLWLMLTVAAPLGLTGCTTNPTTGRSQLAVMSREEEIKLGTDAKPELTQEFGGKVNSPELQAYVTEVGSRLAAVTEDANPSLPWEFTLLDSPVINAFALPGGKVFLSRGLADKMTNEAQLAAVLGHEVGHVTARHTNDRMVQQAVLVGGGSILGSIADAVLGTGSAGSQAGQSIGNIAALSYSRDQEIEADRLGMRYMEKLKYDPMGAVEVQEILKREAESAGGRPPEILSTHPASATRIAELMKRFEKYYSHTVNNPEYQKHPDRYEQRYLSIARRLPPPPAPKSMLPRDGNPRDSALASLMLADPGVWCAHCRSANPPGSE